MRGGTFMLGVQEQQVYLTLRHAEGKARNVMCVRMVHCPAGACTSPALALVVLFPELTDCAAFAMLCDLQTHLYMHVLLKNT